MARERAAAKAVEIAPEKKTRVRAAAVVEAPAAKGRTRAKVVDIVQAPVAKGKAESAPRGGNLTLPKRRKAPVANTNEAVALLLGAALNANPDVDSLSKGKINLLLMGARLASSSQEAAALIDKAVKAGVVGEA